MRRPAPAVPSRPSCVVDENLIAHRDRSGTAVEECDTEQKPSPIDEADNRSGPQRNADGLCFALCGEGRAVRRMEAPRWMHRVGASHASAHCGPRGPLARRPGHSHHLTSSGDADLDLDAGVRAVAHDAAPLSCCRGLSCGRGLPYGTPSHELWLRKPSICSFRRQPSWPPGRFPSSGRCLGACPRSKGTRRPRSLRRGVPRSQGPSQESDGPHALAGSRRDRRRWPVGLARVPPGERPPLRVTGQTPHLTGHPPPGGPGDRDPSPPLAGIPNSPLTVPRLPCQRMVDAPVSIPGVAVRTTEDKEGQ